jgi:hypothetical protein
MSIRLYLIHRHPGGRLLKGKLEESMLLKIAAVYPEKVSGLDTPLAVIFDQDGVDLLRPACHMSGCPVYSRVIPNRPVMTD